MGKRNRGKRAHRQLGLEPGAYHSMSLQQKQRAAIDGARAPLVLVRCARCLARCPSDQLAGHAERCEGSREALHAAIARRPV